MNKIRKIKEKGKSRNISGKGRQKIETRKQVQKKKIQKRRTGE